MAEAKKTDDENREWSELAKRSQAGDSQAYHQLLQKILPRLRLFVRQKLGTLATEDLVQEILIAVHTSLNTYDPKRNFKSWVFAVAKYKTIDFLREHQRKWSKEAEFDEKTVTISDADTNEGDEDRGQLLTDAIAGLPSEMKRAVELTKIKGLSTSEAAQKEGVSSAALRTRISRAYQILRRKLERDFG